MTAYAKLLQSDYYCMGTLRAAAAGLVWPGLESSAYTHVFLLWLHM